MAITDEDATKVAQAVAPQILGALDLAIKSYGPSRGEYVTKDAKGVPELDYDEFVDSVTRDVAARAAADPISKRMHGGHAPQRSELEDGGVVAKAGEVRGAIYGGSDLYAEAGSTDAEVAVNLFLAKTILGTNDPRTGQPMRHDWTGQPLVSDRLNHVLVTAAQKAIGAAPEPIPTHVETSTGFRKSIDADGFVGKGYRAMRDSARTKAMTSTGANAGDEWVPTFATAELWRDVHLETQVSASVRRINMPTNPYQLPTQESDITFRLAPTENTAVSASDVGTDKATLTAKKVMAYTRFSGEFTEDSIVPAMPSLRATLVRRGAQCIDDIIVSGDTETAGTGNVNSDDAAPAADSFYLALDGLRKFTLVTNTGQVSNFAGAVTTTLFGTLRALMGRYGARASDLRIVLPQATLNGMYDISSVKTLDAYGPNATILQGELGRFFNIPILLSEAIPATDTDKVADDGKYTTTSPAAANTKGWLLLFNRTGWTQGFRRELNVESFRDITTDTNILVASFRMALIPSGISVQHTAIARNVTI